MNIPNMRDLRAQGRAAYNSDHYGNTSVRLTPANQGHRHERYGASATAEASPRDRHIAERNTRQRDHGRR